MANLKNSVHDHYFRSVIENPKVALEFFEKNIPAEIVNHVDLSTLTLQKDSFIGDDLKLQISDALFSVTMKDEPAYFYLLFEHMSSQQRLLPYKMLQYVMAILKKYTDTHKNTKHLPFVYPIVLYTGKKPYTQPLNLFELFGDNKDLAEQFMFKKLHLLDISQETDITIKEKYYWFKLAALLAKNSHLPDMIPVVNELIDAMKDMEQEGEYDYIFRSIDYVFKVGEFSDYTVYTKAITENLPHIDEDKIMTIADQLRQEGYEKAMKAALHLREEGKAEKEREMVLKMLDKHMSLESVADITGISVEKIKSYMQ